jgi:CO/xanthine dehydrogenase Mo-binding subunit
MNPHGFDYRIPRAGDLPELTHLVLEKADPVGPYRVRGVGEIGMVPTPAAIANAIYDAVGVRMTELPITPERLLRALRAGER